MSVTGIHLITGLIGSGKTLRAVSLIQAEVDKGRAVYACNINGLNIPGVIPFDDPKQWRDLPPGSLLVVDEAQRYWRARRSSDVPPELQAMETSRHDAVSLLLLTQQPTYLDKHLRGLVTKHEHLYRRMGLPSAQMFSWERCVDDPQSQSDKDGAEQSIFVYPKQHFGKYKSAEQHTVKPRLGLRGKMLIGAVFVIAGAIGYIVVGVSSGDDDKAARASASAGLPPEAPGRAAVIGAMPDDQYFGRMVPRAGAMPWSAPIFDDRQVQAQPFVACMSALGGRGADGQDWDASCSCITEQGTRYQMDTETCLVIARHGPEYDPFRRAEDDRREGDGQRDRNRQNGPQERDTAPAAAVLAGDYENLVGVPVGGAL